MSVPQPWTGQETYPSVLFPFFGGWGGVFACRRSCPASARMFSLATVRARHARRELMRDVFLASSPDVTHSLNAVAIGWGQLLLLDLSLTMDKSSEPFNAPCADPVDVWCPLGEASDPIPFYRSDAEVTATSRNPINYATSYIDLDFVYGRSKDESDRLRGVDGDGKLAIGDDGLPVKNDDGTWLVSPRLPVICVCYHLFCLPSIPKLLSATDVKSSAACDRTISPTRIALKRCTNPRSFLHALCAFADYPADCRPANREASGCFRAPHHPSARTQPLLRRDRARHGVCGR